MLHCTPTELDDQPAILLDWFLEFQCVEAKAERSLTKPAEGKAKQ